MVIGVAGKYCAGKNTLIKPLEDMGYYHIDVDKLGHTALENRKKELTETFGNSIIRKDGTVDRRALGAIVFSDPKEKVKLEKIVHPEMVNMTRQIISERENVIVNAAILFEMGLDKLCDLIFWVQAPAIIRLFRGIRRDNMPAKAVIKRLWAQRKIGPNKFSSKADIITINNVGKQQTSAEKIKEILNLRK